MAAEAILIKDVEEELMKYPPKMAWDLLCHLNESPILNGIKAWRDAYPSLLNKYRDRLVESMNQQKEMAESVKTAIERPTNYYNYEAGATHDDKRHQLLLSEEREKVLRQKQTEQIEYERHL